MKLATSLVRVIRACGLLLPPRAPIPADRSPPNNVGILLSLLSAMTTIRRLTTTSLYPVVYKEVLTVFLTIYKENRCLWDTKHPKYTCRMSRAAAYELLLAKYRELEPNLTMVGMKKKLDRLRLSYRREHKKVLLAASYGKQYCPQLWYYEMLTFLNNISDFRNIQARAASFNTSTSNTEDSLNCDYEQNKNCESKDEEHEFKTEYLENECTNTTNDDVMANFESCEEKFEDHSMEEIKKKKRQYLDPLTESLSSTIGFQLASLTTDQRNIAEKLISDIIFQARYEKLTYDSNIKLEDC